MKEATGKERKKLFRTIRRKKKNKRSPFSVMFELTRRCNFKCPHCYLGTGKSGRRRELTTTGVKRILDQLADSGVYRIGFTGGEPLSRADIFDILDYANRKGFRYGLLTNGYLIDAKTADRLKKVNVEKVDITFNSLCRETFAYLSGVKDGYSKVLRAVNLLLRRDMQVTLKSTVTRLNKDEIEALGRYCRDREIPYRIDGEVLPCKGGDTAWVDRLSISQDELTALRKKVYPEMYDPEKLSRRRRRRRRRSRVFNCGVGINTFSINPYGQMNFCVEIDYPGIDILNVGLKKAWESLKGKVDEINALARESESFACRNCYLLPYCGWCAGRSYLETGEFNRCSEYFKKRARQRRKAARGGVG